MDIPETVKKTLNESNLTNPSKLYTPFTLFAVYFAIYFKAELLGQIFLSNNWDITAQALARLGDPGPREWFIFAAKVSAYSIGMLVLYGIAQFLAVGIWALSNRLNTRVNAELHRGKYVAASILEKAEERIEELRSDNRKLYTELASYHTWRPEDISRLKQELLSKTESLNASLEKIENQTSRITTIENELSQSDKYIKQLETEAHNLNVQLTSTEGIIINMFDIVKISVLRKPPLELSEISDLLNNDDRIQYLDLILSGIPKKVSLESEGAGKVIGVLLKSTSIIQDITINEAGKYEVSFLRDTATSNRFMQLLRPDVRGKLQLTRSNAKDTI